MWRLNEAGLQHAMSLCPFCCSNGWNCRFARKPDGLTKDAAAVTESCPAYMQHHRGLAVCWYTGVIQVVVVVPVPPPHTPAATDACEYLC